MRIDISRRHFLELGAFSIPILSCNYATQQQGAIGLHQSLFFSDGSQIERFAKQEILTYLERLNSPRIAVESQECRKIIGCLQDSAAARPVMARLPRLEGQAYVLAAAPGAIFLVGGAPTSLLYATYELLELLGCRWLAPGFEFYQQRHEHLPAAPDKSIDRVTRIRQPDFRRRTLYVEEGHSHNLSSLLPLISWMPKQRFNALAFPVDYRNRGQVRWDEWRNALTPELARRGIAIEVGGHGYQNFLNPQLLFDDHPDWFAKDRSGRRTGTKPNWVFCTSKVGAVKKLQSNVLAYLKERPEIAVFDFWPPDSARWCSCHSCSLLGSPQRRHALLVNSMANLLSKECPKVRLQCIAYADHLAPPSDIEINPSVLVDVCTTRQSFEGQIYDAENEFNVPYVQALEAWKERFQGEIGIYSYYRKYAWRSLPNLLPRYIQNDLRFYRGLGVEGISCYAEPGDWFTYEPNHYLLGKLSYSLECDVESLLDDYCSSRYGSEGRLARQVIELLARVVRQACRIPFTTLKEAAYYRQSEEQVSSAFQEVQAALNRQTERGGVDLHLKRLGLMLEYVQQDLALQRDIASAGLSASRRTQVDRLSEFHRKHSGEGVFLWHRRLSKADQYVHYQIDTSRN